MLRAADALRLAAMQYKQIKENRAVVNDEGEVIGACALGLIALANGAIVVMGEVSPVPGHEHPVRLNHLAEDYYPWLGQKKISPISNPYQTVAWKVMYWNDLQNATTEQIATLLDELDPTPREVEVNEEVKTEVMEELCQSTT